MSDFCGLLVMTDREGKSTGYKHSLLLWPEKSLSESAQLNKEKGILKGGGFDVGREVRRIDLSLDENKN